jgi:hypothetical protein
MSNNTPLGICQHRIVSQGYCRCCAMKAEADIHILEQRIALLEKEKLELAQHDSAQVLANDRLLQHIAELATIIAGLSSTQNALATENAALRDQVEKYRGAVDDWYNYGYDREQAGEILAPPMESGQ